MSAESTTLNLLTREGAIQVTFRPALDAAQYDELLKIVREIESLQQLQESLAIAAMAWNRQFHVSAC